MFGDLFLFQGSLPFVLAPEVEMNSLGGGAVGGGGAVSRTGAVVGHPHAHGPPPGHAHPHPHGGGDPRQQWKGEKRYQRISFSL